MTAKNYLISKEKMIELLPLKDKIKNLNTKNGQYK